MIDGFCVDHRFHLFVGHGRRGRGPPPGRVDTVDCTVPLVPRSEWPTTTATIATHATTTIPTKVSVASVCDPTAEAEVPDRRLDRLGLERGDDLGFVDLRQVLGGLGVDLTGLSLPLDFDEIAKRLRLARLDDATLTLIGARLTAQSVARAPARIAVEPVDATTATLPPPRPRARRPSEPPTGTPRCRCRPRSAAGVPTKSDEPRAPCSPSGLVADAAEDRSRPARSAGRRTRAPCRRRSRALTTSVITMFFSSASGSVILASSGMRSSSRVRLGQAPSRSRAADGGSASSR